MPKKLQYVQSFAGYNYLRFKGQPRLRLPDGPTSGAKFMAAYKTALADAKAADLPRALETKKHPAGGPTVREVVAGHLASGFFRDLAPKTQAGRRYHLIAWAEGRPNKGWAACGDLPILGLGRDEVGRELNLRKEVGGLGAGRNWLVAVRSMLTERKDARALPEDFDPTVGLKGSTARSRRRRKDDGFKTWTREMVETYRGHYPSGSPERLAFEMIYWTGAACCDVIKLTRADIIDGLFRFDRQKTDTMSCPKAAPELLAEIAAAKVEGLGGPIVRSRLGLPFSHAERFSEQFRKWAKEAGIPPGYTAHGVRKRAATDDAEAGRSTTWLKAKYGWLRSSEADLYTEAADRVRVIMNEETKAETIH